MNFNTSMFFNLRLPFLCCLSLPFPIHLQTKSDFQIKDYEHLPLDKFSLICFQRTEIVPVFPVFAAAPVLPHPPAPPPAPELTIKTR
jgi:hypothetical protein